MSGGDGRLGRACGLLDSLGGGLLWLVDPRSPASRRPMLRMVQHAASSLNDSLDTVVLLSVEPPAREQETIPRSVRARKRWVRSAVFRLAAYPVIAYLTAGAVLYFEQGALLFPAPRTFARTTPADCGLRFDDLRIPVNATDHIHAWWFPAETSSGRVVLVFHGNGYVLEDMVGDETVELHETGANLLLVDYRGYGSSSPLSPSEVTVDEDADAALAWLLHQHGTSVGNVFLLGRSIGSGPATHLAAANPGLAGLILLSPLSSIDDAAKGLWFARIYPTGLMLRTHFDNLSRIGSVQAPLLIVSGTADTLAPLWMAKALFARAGQPKQLYLVPGAGHNDLLEVGGPALTRVLQTFVAQKP